MCALEKVISISPVGRRCKQRTDEAAKPCVLRASNTAVESAKTEA